METNVSRIVFSLLSDINMLSQYQQFPSVFSPINFILLGFVWLLFANRHVYRHVSFAPFANHAHTPENNVCGKTVTI